MEENSNPQSSKLNPLLLVSIVVILLTLVGLGGYLFLSQNNNSTNQASSQASVTPTIAPSKSEGNTFALEDVAMHADEEDCWLVIESGVYDVTKFISLHPGGKEILQGCGKDATAMFNKRPNDGTSHSPRANEMLSRFKIGDLSK